MCEPAELRAASAGPCCTCAHTLTRAPVSACLCAFAGACGTEEGMCTCSQGQGAHSDVELGASTGQTRTPMEAAEQDYVRAANMRAAWDSSHPVEQRSAEDWQIYDRLKADVKEGACLAKGCLPWYQAVCAILSAGHASLHPCTCLFVHTLQG